MLKRMSCHRMASSSLCWPLMMSMPPMFTKGSASTRRVMPTTCRHMPAAQQLHPRQYKVPVEASTAPQREVIERGIGASKGDSQNCEGSEGVKVWRGADLVAVLDGLGLLQEGLEGRPVHSLPLHAAGCNRVKNPQQHISVPQRLHQVLDVDLVVQQAQQPHPEGALLPRVLPGSQTLFSTYQAT